MATMLLEDYPSRVMDKADRERAESFVVEDALKWSRAKTKREKRNALARLEWSTAHLRSVMNDPEIGEI